jgi:NADH-quinone oxidoreductase subunit L
MFRLLFLTFFGESRADSEVEHHVHESPWSMLAPLVVLAALSVIGGYVNWPVESFGKFLEPVFENRAAISAQEYAKSTEWLLMALSVGIALMGIAVALVLFIRRPGLRERLAAPPGFFHQLALNKYYVDELYDALFVNRTKNLGNGLAAFDLAVVDGGVNGVGWSTRMSAELSRLWDMWVIDGLVNVVGFGTKLLSYPVRVLQSGVVQTYAFFIVLGVLLFMTYYLVHFRG